MEGNILLGVYMRYCKLCLQPDTRPNIIFDENGVCAACLFQQQRKDIDWKERHDEIMKIAQWAKDRSNYFNCVVGVSGGRDSTFQALYARDVLGLKPLLVNAAPDGITPCGRENFENLIQMGFDLISVRVNPIINKITMKDAFYRYGNPAKPTEYYLWSSAYRVAINYKIPLVIQGENTAITLGIRGMKPSGDALQIFKHNTIQEETSIWESEKVKKSDLFFWTPPTKEEIDASGIKAVFLNYYSPDWSWSGNTQFSIKRGLNRRENHKPENIGYLSAYVQVDSDLWPVNNLLKYLKFGFGGVTDELCNDLREGRITQDKVCYDLGGDTLTREKAIQLIERYDGKCNEDYIRKLCDYLGISLEEFWRHVDNNVVNKTLFKKDQKTVKWVPKFKVGVGLKNN
jgi:N-acetyl sugar amidotransferase